MIPDFKKGAYGRYFPVNITAPGVYFAGVKGHGFRETEKIMVLR